MAHRSLLVTRIVVVAVLVAAAGGAVLATRGPIRVGSLVRSVTGAIVTGTIGVREAVVSLAAVARSPDRLRSLETELAALRSERAVLVSELADARIIPTAMGVAPLPSTWGRQRAARVLAATVTSFAHELTVDRGRADQVRIGDPVVVHGTLIGTVRVVGKDRAIVRLLSDPGTRIAGAIAGDPAPIGTVEAIPGGGVLLTRIPNDTAIAVGATIVASSVNPRIPYGVPIGSIRELRAESDGFFRRGVIIPFVDPLRTPIVVIMESLESP